LDAVFPECSVPWTFFFSVDDETTLSYCSYKHWKYIWFLPFLYCHMCLVITRFLA
jgi:hypothetical protein